MSCLTLPATASSHVNWSTFSGFDTGYFSILDIAACGGYDAVSGQALSLTQWASRWTTLPIYSDRTCSQLYNDIIFSSPGRSFSSAGLAAVRSEFNYLLSRYFSSHSLASPGEASYDSMQSILLAACRQSPGACDTFQQQVCASCTRTDIAANPFLVALCGCHAPPLSSNYSIAANCDPLCTNITAAPLINESTGLVDACNDTVCVIDNVALTAVESTLGKINITQACTNCTASQGCKCLVDVNTANLSDRLGVDYPVFNQYCPSQYATCFTIDDATQTSVNVPCAESTFNDAVKSYPVKIPHGVWYLVVMVIFLLAVCLWFYHEGYRKTTVSLPVVIRST